ncbi:FAD-binding oxidoreductase [Amycolatopsis acidiphila]|uniref:FAD-binding oxidoreductase n=1 Tax=Amycolatopsis acidiphila TaxID=715473 RepID=A0A558ACB3_9PSEU|nr:FAD-binding oxidoreductase [Amycolatopsis acidiphila]TVT21911.1 FAD-binding oxidoreductase [Amycolatopsis acidiphila]UIJ57332.1 FAD-binding oxidoreductase [Amycolatopsis acidiphila]GHG84757.1 glycolate oxidase [Amycolatopsis acidiphila]
MRAVEDLVLDTLAATTAARRAAEGDRVDGVEPRFVASPTTTAEAAQVMRIAAEHGLAVVARGAGTKLSWGQPPERVDLVVDTSRLDQVVEHGAGDLVVHVQAGVRLDVLQEHLAGARQRLGADPVLPPAAGSGTAGGLIATATSGPLRLSHGAVRDLLIGVTIARADGTIAKAGGKVVKNVAGYDLGKLLTGSWGTLGLVTEAVFRLHPLPARARWVSVPVTSTAAAHEQAQRVLHSQVVPTALELDRPADAPATLAVLVEGIEAGVEGRVTTLLELLGGDAGVAGEAPPWWGRAPWAAGGVALRLTHEIAGLPRLLDAVDDAGRRYGLRPAVRGSAGVGVLYAALPTEAEPEAVAGFTRHLRDSSPAWSGDVVVLDAPPPVKASVDTWGPARGLNLMRRVKDQFDPQRRLAPGRFVGGI